MGFAQEPELWQLENSTGRDFQPAVQRFEVEQLTGRFSVQLDGKDVPAHYDKASGTLLVLASVPAGGGTLTLQRGRKSRARNPKWRKPEIDRERRPVALDKPIRRMGAVLENGVLRATIPIDTKIHGRLELEFLRGGPEFSLAPLGSSVGCVATLKIGEDLFQRRRQGAKTDTRLFSVFPSVVSDIEVLEPNPFQRVLRVETHTWVARNAGAPEESAPPTPLFESTGYTLELTHGSPIVHLHTWRRGSNSYFNHNGVYLNEFDLAQEEIQLRTDLEPELQTLSIDSPRPHPLKLARSVWIEQPRGAVLLDQPQFPSLGLYRPGLFAFDRRLLSVLSQSWDEGWKPIEIPAQDIEDRATLVMIGEKMLAEGDSGTAFRNWLAEIDAPLPEGPAPEVK